MWRRNVKGTAFDEIYLRKNVNKSGKRGDPADERMLSDGGGSMGDFGGYKEFIKKTKPKSTIQKIVPGQKFKQTTKKGVDTVKKGVGTAQKKVERTAKKTFDTAKKGAGTAQKKVKDTMKKVQDTGKKKGGGCN